MIIMLFLNTFRYSKKQTMFKNSFPLFISLLIFSAALISCNNHKVERYTFVDAPIAADIPTHFTLQESEKMIGIEEEKMDDVKYSVLISSLYDLKRGDQQLDIFKNKNSKFHYLLFLNTLGAPVFNDQTFNKLKNAQAYQYDLVMEADTSITIEMVDSKLETFDDKSLVKMKHKFFLSDKNEVFYKTVFFLNISGKTIIAHELNNLELDSESILRSISITE